MSKATVFKTIKRVFWVSLILLVTLFVLSFRTRIVQDDYDPTFHGQTIKFKKPMVYQILEKSDKELSTIDKKIGKRIRTKKDALRATPYREFEEIPEETSFTIISSYCTRKSWAALTDDYREVVFQDDKGIQSIWLVGILSHSDRPDLYKNCEPKPPFPFHHFPYE